MSYLNYITLYCITLHYITHAAQKSRKCVENPWTLSRPTRTVQGYRNVSRKEDDFKLSEVTATLSCVIVVVLVLAVLFLLLNTDFHVSTPLFRVRLSSINRRLFDLIYFR